MSSQSKHTPAGTGSKKSTNLARRQAAHDNMNPRESHGQTEGFQGRKRPGSGKQQIEGTMTAPKEPTIARFATHDLRREHGKKAHLSVPRSAERRTIEAAVAQGAYIV